ncbi:hypothetical protein LJC71_08220 [Desulfosarcina sp. OttesenSCG-928-A07]|nr:hypothetical protein [Desulfosarcina sp. OttesenSCG-928-G17]MDL2329712.1 hypothetical protein [Desulfosarcina sp. OttesenSCG-928-A07]
MDKNAIVQKLRDGIAALREALDKHDGSTLQALASTLKGRFESIKATVQQNEQTQKWIAQSKKYLDDLEASIKTGDKKLSARILDKAESFLGDDKEKKK